jgi:hypothetical protein
VLRIRVVLDHPTNVFLDTVSSKQRSYTNVVQLCANVDFALEELERLWVMSKAALDDLLSVSLLSIY